jgi:hypothetical protein
MVGRTDEMSAQMAKDSNKLNMTLGRISGRMGQEHYQERPGSQLDPDEVQQNEISINSSLHVHIL